MLKKHVVLLLICMLVFPLFTASQVEANQTAKSSTITVDGDELILDTTTETSTFLGNVVALFREYQIKSQKFIYEQKTGLVKIEGQVQMTSNDLRATAQSMEIDLTKEVLTMTGNVEVVRAGQLVKGAVVTYDLKTGTMKVKKARVEIMEIKK